MPPARCLGRRWRIANDEYFKYVPFQLVANALAALCCIPFTFDDPDELIIFGGKFFDVFWVMIWIFCVLILLDIILGYWSTLGKVYDHEGKRKHLNKWLGLRFSLHCIPVLCFWYRVFFSDYRYLNPIWGGLRNSWLIRNNLEGTSQVPSTMNSAKWSATSIL